MRTPSVSPFCVPHAAKVFYGSVRVLSLDCKFSTDFLVKQSGVSCMRTVITLTDLRSIRPTFPGIVGLVPTMGFLHEGHLSLVRRARAECEVVVVSLFVNPAQFGPGEDLEAYPRDEARDAALAADAGADLLFAPSQEEVYPDGFSTTVEVGGVTDVLC